MIAASKRKAAAALVDYEAACAALAQATTEREAAEARLRALAPHAEPHERETGTER